LGTYQKNVVLFDPEKMCWSEYYDYFSDYLVHQVDDILERVDKAVKCRKNCTNNPTCKDFQLVNKFNSSGYQQKVSKYISYIIRSEKDGKGAKIQEANFLYQDQYGKGLIREKR